MSKEKVEKMLFDDLSQNPEITFSHIPPKNIIVNDKLEPSPEFVASVEKFGILQAILVRPAPYKKGEAEGKFIVIDGRRRVLAAKALELKFVPALLVPTATALDASVLTIEAQEQRSDNPIAEYRAIKSLIEEGYSEQGIKNALGISSDRMSKMLTLDKLETKIIAGVQEKKIAVTTALNMAKLSPPYRKKLEKTFKKEGKLLGKDVTEVKQVIAGDQAQAVFQELGKQDFDMPIKEVPKEGDAPDFLGGCKDALNCLENLRDRYIWLDESLGWGDDIQEALDVISNLRVLVGSAE